MRILEFITRSSEVTGQIFQHIHEEYFEPALSCPYDLIYRKIAQSAIYNADRQFAA